MEVHLGCDTWWEVLASMEEAGEASDYSTVCRKASLSGTFCPCVSHSVVEKHC